MAAVVKKRSASSLSDSRSTPLERTAKRRKRTFFSDGQLDRLEEAFEENKFPGIDRRDALARELGIGEDRIHVWFQNRRSRWRKREIKNKPAPVTSPAPPDASPNAAAWAPNQFPVYYPPHFPSTSGAARVPATNNIWSFNTHDGPAYYFPPEIPTTNTARSSVFTGPSFSFVYAPNSPITSSAASPVTMVEERPCSGQGGHHRSSPSYYDSDSTESRHSADEYLAAMSLLSVFSREN